MEHGRDGVRKTGELVGRLKKGNEKENVKSFRLQGRYGAFYNLKE